MRGLLGLAFAALLLGHNAWADGLKCSGDFRAYGQGPAGPATGPLAAARQLDGDPRWTASGAGLIDGGSRIVGEEGALVASAQDVPMRYGRDWSNTAHARLDEGYVDASVGDGRLFVGKRVVSWDVGYAWRPNDMLEAEQRRQLVDERLEGQLLAQWEWYGEGSSATALVVRQRPSADSARSLDMFDETAVAGRWYADLQGKEAYVFLKAGARSGVSAGLAGVAVVSEAVELHASVRHDARRLVPSYAVANASLARTDPFLLATGGAAWQGLTGMTWTNEHQTSLIVEAWWDGLAPAPEFWRTWSARNAGLLGQGLAMPASSAPAAGNLRWQANALQVQSIWQRNLFVHLSQKMGELEWTGEMLYWLGGGGCVATLGLSRQIDRILLALKWREQACGPRDAVARQFGQEATWLAGMQMNF